VTLIIIPNNSQLFDVSLSCGSYKLQAAVAAYLSGYNVQLPPTKEQLNAFARVRLSVCLSVCLLARLQKNACMDLDEMFNWHVLVGTWTN